MEAIRLLESPRHMRQMMVVRSWRPPPARSIPPWYDLQVQVMRMELKEKQTISIIN